MSIAEKLTTVAENQQRVFDAGKKAEYDAFWDVHQSNGQARNYSNRFYSWDTENYKPKYPIIVQANGSCQNCFAFSNITDTIVDITFQSGCDVQYFFQRCSKLETVRKIICSKTAKLSGIFYQCSALKNVTFEGEIGYGFDVSSSSVITHDSLMSIINALETKTSGTHTMIFGATNLAKLTDAEKAIATEKGWTLA